MFAKQWQATHGDHTITVTNNWEFPLRTEARLYIDGERVDDTKSSFSNGVTPVLRGAIKNGEGRADRVEVFVKSGLLRVLVKICVNGERVGGDSF